MHKKLKLSNSNSYALVSENDFEKVKERGTWRLHKTGYVCRDTMHNGKPATEYLHRFILGLHFGDNLVADHINGNKTENTRENLRILTQGQNAQNITSPNKKGTSQFRGVSKDKNSWRGSVNVPGEKRKMKSFKTEKAAALWAYQERLKHQPFAPRDKYLDELIAQEQKPNYYQMTIFDIK